MPPKIGLDQPPKVELEASSKDATINEAGCVPVQIGGGLGDGV
jgi:hypothetical protein